MSDWFIILILFVFALGFAASLVADLRELFAVRNELKDF